MIHTIITELGIEKRCTKCGEYYPADTEFYYRGHGSDGLHTWCKACVNENTYKKREEAREKRSEKKRME